MSIVSKTAYFLSITPISFFYVSVNNSGVNLSPEHDFLGHSSKAYSDSETTGSVAFVDDSNDIFSKYLSKNYSDSESTGSIGYVDPNHKQDFIGPSFTGDSEGGSGSSSESVGSIAYISSDTPSFHGSHIDGNGNEWSESQIKSKIHEAENKVHYYKSRIAERTNDMRGRTDPVKIRAIASDIRGFERDLDKWEHIEKKWRNML